MKSVLQHLSKKALSAVLALAVVICSMGATFSAFADLGSNSSSVDTIGTVENFKVTYGSPAVPMVAGYSIDLSALQVEFEKGGSPVSGADITWEAEAGTSAAEYLDAANKIFSALSTGTFKLTAKNGEKSKTVYIMANEVGDYTYELVDVDFAKDSFPTDSWLYTCGDNGLSTNPRSNFYKYEMLANGDAFRYPTATNPYLKTYKNSNVHMLLYKAPILADFADYTFTSRVAAGYDYNANTARGFILRANVDFDTPVYDANATNKTIFADAVSQGVNGSGLYFVQRRYGAISMGAFGKAGLLSSGLTWGFDSATIHSLKGDDYLKFVNSTETVDGNSTAATPLAGDHSYVLSLQQDVVKTVEITLTGDDVKYSMGGNVLLDTTDDIYKLTGANKPSTATNVKFNDYHTNFATNGVSEAGNAIGFTFIHGRYDIYSFSVKLNGISVADDLPICTKIQLETVSASNPVINATAGQEIDLTSYIYEFSDGSAHIGTAMDWDFADTNAYANENFVTLSNNKKFSASEAGIYALTGTYGAASTTVYIYVGMADAYIMNDRSPALPMFIKTRMDLSHVAIQFGNGQYYYGRDIIWTIDESNENDAGIILNNTAKNIAAISTGVYTLKATVKTDGGENSRKVYVVANNQGDNNFCIVNLDFTAGGYNQDDWIYVNGAFGNYPSAALTVQDIKDLDGSDGLKMAYGEKRMALYKSDVLNEFSDYTVSAAFRVEANHFQDLNQYFGIITRAQVDFENATKDSTNIFKTPASGASPALSAMLAPYGGVAFQVFNDTFQEAHNGGEKIGYYTWPNGEDLKPFSVNNESHSDMVLSHKHTSTTEYIPVSVKLSGTDVVYTIRDKVLLDTTKETLSTMKLNLGDRIPIPDSAEHGNDKSERKAAKKDPDGNVIKDENGNTVYDFYYEDTVLEEGTVTSESLKTLINNKGTTEAGTVGFTTTRIKDGDIQYLKVSLNGVTAANMPAAEEYNPYIVKSNSPALPMTAGTRIDLNKFLIQIGSLAYETKSLTFGAVAPVQNGAVANGVKIEGGYITAYERGVYSVNLSSATGSTTLYIVVKNAEEEEYVIYEGDYRSDDADVSDWKTTITDGDGNIITSGAMYEKVEETTENYVPDYKYVRTADEKNGVVYYTYYKAVKEVDVNYSGNYNDIPNVNGFVPYDTSEIAKGFSATTGPVTWLPYYCYTTLDNKVVNNLSDYTVTASFKSYPGYRGAIGVIGRVSNLNDGKFTASSTAYGFAASVVDAYKIPGALPLKTPFAILGNNFSNITDAAISKYYSNIVGNGYIHRTYSVKYSADTLTVSTPNDDTYTISGIASNAGGVGFVAYNKDTLQSSTAIPVLTDFKVSLKDIDISNLPCEAIAHTPAATPDAGEIYTDNGNYKFTVKNGAINKFGLVDPTKPCPQKVVIPNAVNGTAVSSIGVNVFYIDVTNEIRRSIGEVVISEGIVSTGNNAFRSTTLLDTVTFPSTLETIGSESFMDSGVVEAIFDEDDALTTIGNKAFYGARSLRKVQFGRNLKSIGDNAFSNTVSLYSIELPIYLKSIGNAAFSASALEKVYVYNRTVLFGTNVFPMGTVIYGATGSTAQEYADANGHEFRAIDSKIAEIEAAEAERIRLEGEKKEQQAQKQDSNTKWELYYNAGDKTYLINGFTPSAIDSGKFVLPAVYDYVSGDTVKEDVAVIGIRANAFKNSIYKRQIHNIVISKGYKDIGESAFAGCSNLMYLDLPDTLVTVGKYAFLNNTSLKELTVPERLVKIGDSAFAGNTALTKINFESDSVLNTIGASAFSDTAVEMATLPFNVRYVGANAFSGSKLKEITITNKLCEIGENAFPTGTIIHGVKGSLAETYAAQNGYAFKDDVADVYDATINKDDAATKLTYSANPPYYNIASYTGNGGKVTIPYETDYTAADGTVTKGAVISQIQYNAFDWSIDKHKVQKVVLPDGIVSIGASSFFHCYNMVSINIPESVQSIGAFAFSQCDIYGSLSFGRACQTIKEYAFAGNKHLTDVYIYNTSCKIGEAAFDQTVVIHGYKDSTAERFASKYGLAFVEITETVKLPGISSYKDNKNYTFTFEEETGTITAYNRKDAGKPYSEKVTFPAKINGKTVNSVGSSLFKAKPFTMSIEAAVFEDGITVIGDNVFAGAARLTTVKFPNTLTTIGVSAFSGSGLAGDITIPKTVTSIGSSAFAKCENLTSVTIDNPTVKIGTGAFSGLGSGFVIRGLKGSTAWEYYERNKSTGIKFVSIGDYVAEGEGDSEGEGQGNATQQGANGEYNEDPNNTGAGAINDLTLIIIIALGALILLLLIGAVVIIIVAMSGDDDDDDDDDDDEYDDDDDDEEDEDDEDDE